MKDIILLSIRCQYLAQGILLRIEGDNPSCIRLISLVRLSREGILNLGNVLNSFSGKVFV